jgi:hypothetical protein
LLEHSSVVHVSQQFKSQPPRRTHTIIQTLDPSRLRPLDFIDASSKWYMRVTGLDCHSCYNGSYTKRDRFPEGTRGFMYYCPPNPGAPSAAGGIRFRLTPGNDPASFIQGSDLRMPNGLPWCTSLLTIAGEKWQHYQLIQQQLINDGLVTPGLLETCTTMMKAAGKHIPGRGSRIIHSFGQLFHVEFDREKFLFSTLTMNQLRHHHCFHLFGEPRTHRRRPYMGEYQCCISHANTA